MVSERLKRVILAVLKLADFNIQDDTTANKVPKWDSLNHVNIIVAIESEYGVKFKATEILKVKNVGELQRLIDSKTSR
jgi:acyl carrier protein